MGSVTNAAGARPVVIFWYGGSWGQSGSRSWSIASSARRWSRAGLVTVLPDYRPIPRGEISRALSGRRRAKPWRGCSSSHGVRRRSAPHRADGPLRRRSHGGIRRAEPSSCAEAGRADPELASQGSSGSLARTCSRRTRACCTSIFAGPTRKSDWQRRSLRVAGEPPHPRFSLTGSSDRLVSVEQTEKLRDALRRETCAWKRPLPRCQPRGHRGGAIGARARTRSGSQHAARFSAQRYFFEGEGGLCR